MATTTIRRANERGFQDHGWLKTFHSFSFADYYDPRHMGFRALRVINDDVVAPGRGFGRHPHRDMEIITYVLAGAVKHQDSMGNGSVIVPGDVQRMSAGTGVFHSEENPLPDAPLHLLQIWVMPDRAGYAPSYEQKHFSAEDKRGRLRLVASPDGAEGSVTIHQDARLYATLLPVGTRVTHALASGRHAWVHVARGDAEVNGTALTAGDALSTSDAGELVLTGRSDDAELLVFDLA